jgi:DNA-binding transcriptional ArsR family regulator
VVEELGGKVNQPTVSHHLKLLAAANLVQVREEGRQRFYTLNQAYFTECCVQLIQNFAPDYAGEVIELEAIYSPGQPSTKWLTQSRKAAKEDKAR